MHVNKHCYGVMVCFASRDLVKTERVVRTAVGSSACGIGDGERNGMDRLSVVSTCAPSQPPSDEGLPEDQRQRRPGLSSCCSNRSLRAAPLTSRAKMEYARVRYVSVVLMTR